MYEGQIYLYIISNGSVFLKTTQPRCQIEFFEWSRIYDEKYLIRKIGNSFLSFLALDAFGLDIFFIYVERTENNRLQVILGQFM